MTYQQRWLLAVALKQPYPRLETGSVAQEIQALTPQAQQMVGKAFAVSAGFGAVFGGLLGLLIGTNIKRKK